MNRLLKDLINKLKLNPLVSDEDVEYLKNILKDFYLEKNIIKYLDYIRTFLIIVK